MAKGDHIFVSKTGYSHHGIDIGNGKVIHYTGEPGSKSNAAISETTKKEFSSGLKVQVVKYGKCLPVSRTLELAKSRVGEKKYNLVFNNCEHFAIFCKTEKHESEQVNDAVSGVGAVVGTGAAVAGSLTAVSSAGAASLSGPGIMSGLAAIGPGGVIGGIATLAAVPAVVTNIAVSRTLKDDDSLPDKERSLRSAGRTAAKVGTAAGAAATVVTISAVGTTAGLSGAGIVSGLAAIGGTVGGGMAAGVAMSVAAPAVVAGVAGWGLYKIGKWIW